MNTTRDRITGPQGAVVYTAAQIAADPTKLAAGHWVRETTTDAAGVVVSVVEREWHG